MAPSGETTVPPTRRTRKSIGGGPPTKRTLDKENATLDVGSATGGTRKKSRSKSMGPGGFDLLKSGTGNRRASIAVPTPRSILKPTMPPIQDIPSFKPKQQGSNEPSGTRVLLRTEEEQQAAARKREEQERAQLAREIKDRRDARRKSLANRRVSFAAEATLHTFHDLEEMQDSTTSTDSTRRASQQQQQQQQEEEEQPQPPPAPDSDPPSTPPDAIEEEVAESPAHQGDLHQRKRRRSSAASSTYGSDDTMASTVYDSDFENADGVADIQAVEMEGSSDEDGTIMTVDAEEMTSASTASPRSPRSAYENDTTGSLDENLRLAARRAVTQSIDEDEEVIAGFAGWGKKNPSSQGSSQRSSQGSIGQGAAKESHIPEGDGSDADADADEDMDMDMDMTKAVGGIVYPKLPSPEKDDDDVNEELSMDVTTALGGILSKAKAFLRRKSVNPTPQQEPEEPEEQTMDFTTAVGGIQSGRAVDRHDHDNTEINEDMSMEFTTAVGGLLPGGLSKSGQQNNRRRTIVTNDEDDDGAMDMTMGVGRILPAEEAEVEDEQTTGMDMTMAVGGIIKPAAATPEARSAGRKIMEQEADEPLLSSPMRRTPSPVRTTPRAQQQQQRRAKTPPSIFGTASSSPMRNLSSPTKKSTPRSPTKPRLFQQDPSTGINTPQVVLTPQGRRLSGVGVDRPGLGSPRVAEVFDRRESIGKAAGEFVLTSSAQATAGQKKRNVVFADPRVLEAEIEREQAEHDDEEEEDQDQEHREGSVNNLMDMIQGMSPQKKKATNPLRGRKSLHVGSALGLLGKRPHELDEDEDQDGYGSGYGDEDGVKRLKGHQGSPVKNIRLRSPPSKAETTTGRKTRPSLRSVDRLAVPDLASSPHQRATTPRGQDHDTLMGTVEVAEVDVQEEDEDDGERMHLQDFLNMTSIRFMELTTTKRRHTIAPGGQSGSRESAAADAADDMSLERCVVAGACTVPMLELYQHSCRELKKYISEGRRIVREIETETFEENPPLFREYLTATPEFRGLMDTQFKNVKTHARLLSKAMWYEWRMKLLQDGLREGLRQTAEGMDADDARLKQRERMLAEVVLPDLLARREALEREVEELEVVVREMEDCDPAELADARAELEEVENGLAEKTRMWEELKGEMEEVVREGEQLAERKQRCLEEIREAEQMREAYRGWSSEEINKHRAQTDAIEKHHGWAIVSIAQTTITMRYRREVELTFDLASFQPKTPKKTKPIPIKVNYTGTECPPEKFFFLRHLRTYLQSPKFTIKTGSPRALLTTVSTAWDQAGSVTEQIRRLRLSFPTTVVPESNSNSNGSEADGSEGTLQVTSSLLLGPLQTRVEVTFHVTLGSWADEPEKGKDGLAMNIRPEAKVVYGEPFQPEKMTEFVVGRLGKDAGVGWDEVVLGLLKRLGRRRGERA
ncbi:uncharacterized protein C8A04DRAFT_13710 [Dichotomopilus funicola]|uniref:Spc7 kinetochore protein domain-containing protein n=1 Tax=Dichotomopilus funicola TaxID=1934379 RepID=A0AAN6ZKJ5_9PEZI|nr:hypothetical protein C8A04DRAFT_13710 [Dichotomopilus funicola]